MNYYVIYNGIKGYVREMYYKTQDVGVIKLLKDVEITEEYTGKLIKKLTKDQELKYNMKSYENTFYLMDKKLFDLPISQFCWQVLLPLLVIMGIDWGVLEGITHVLDTSFVRLVLNSLLSVFIVGFMAWGILLSQMEKNTLLQFINQFVCKFKR